MLSFLSLIYNIYLICFRLQMHFLLLKYNAKLKRVSTSNKASDHGAVGRRIVVHRSVVIFSLNICKLEEAMPRLSKN